MGRIVTVGWGTLLLIATAGCVPGFGGLKGSGEITALEFSERDFSTLRLGSGARSRVVQSSDYSVVIRIDDNLTEYLDVEKQGRELSIRLKPMRSYHNITFEVDIGMPDLETLDLSGGSRCVLSPFDLAHDLDIELSGGSQLDGSASALDIGLSLSGGSRMELEGQAETARLDGSGGSRFEMDGFRAVDAFLDLSGGSRATLRVEGELTGDLSGGSQGFYLGEPRLGKISTSGGASVRKR